jgi:predicted flavoprotein YhiN
MHSHNAALNSLSRQVRAKGSIKQMTKLMLTAQGIGCAGVLRCSQSVMPNAKKQAMQQAAIQIFRDLMETVSEYRRPK